MGDEYDAAVETCRGWDVGDLVKVSASADIVVGKLGRVLAIEHQGCGQFDCRVDVEGIEVWIMQDDLVEPGVLDRLADEA